MTHNMKYIDADRLRAEIGRFSSTEYNGNTLGDDVANGALDYVLELIDSLQQEKQTDKQVVVITESHGYANIEWDCRSIDDVKGLLAAGAHYVSKHQEQPKVDLEKEIIRYQREDMDRDTTVGDVARHFYKLELKAKNQ